MTTHDAKAKHLNLVMGAVTGTLRVVQDTRATELKNSWDTLSPLPRLPGDEAYDFPLKSTNKRTGAGHWIEQYATKKMLGPTALLSVLDVQYGKKAADAVVRRLATLFLNGDVTDEAVVNRVTEAVLRPAGKGGTKLGRLSEASKATLRTILNGLTNELRLQVETRMHRELADEVCTCAEEIVCSKCTRLKMVASKPSNTYGLSIELTDEGTNQLYRFRKKTLEAWLNTCRASGWQFHDRNLLATVESTNTAKLISLGLVDRDEMLADFRELCKDFSRHDGNDGVISDETARYVLGIIKDSGGIGGKLITALDGPPPFDLLLYYFRASMPWGCFDSPGTVKDVFTENMIPRDSDTSVDPIVLTTELLEQLKSVGCICRNLCTSACRRIVYGISFLTVPDRDAARDTWEYISSWKPEDYTECHYQPAAAWLGRRNTVVTEMFSELSEFICSPEALETRWIRCMLAGVQPARTVRHYSGFNPFNSDYRAWCDTPTEMLIELLSKPRVGSPYALSEMAVVLESFLRDLGNHTAQYQEFAKKCTTAFFRLADAVEASESQVVKENFADACDMAVQANGTRGRYPVSNSPVLKRILEVNSGVLMRLLEQFQVPSRARSVDVVASDFGFTLHELAFLVAVETCEQFVFVGPDGEEQLDGQGWDVFLKMACESEKVPFGQLLETVRLIVPAPEGLISTQASQPACEEAEEETEADAGGLDGQDLVQPALGV